MNTEKYTHATLYATENRASAARPNPAFRAWILAASLLCTSLGLGTSLEGVRAVYGNDENRRGVRLNPGELFLYHQNGTLQAEEQAEDNNRQPVNIANVQQGIDQLRVLPSVTNANFILLAQAPFFRNLTILNLRGCRNIVAHNGNNPNNGRLNLNSLPFLENLQLDDCPNLTTLNLSNCNSLNILVLLRLIRLDTLRITNCAQLNTLDLTLPALQTLLLQGCPIQLITLHGRGATGCISNLRTRQSLANLDQLQRLHLGGTLDNNYTNDLVALGQRMANAPNPRNQVIAIVVGSTSPQLFNAIRAVFPNAQTR